MLENNGQPFEINDQTPFGGAVWVRPTAKTDASQLMVHKQEGQLSVDVLETKTELVVIATMAGTKPDDIELHLHNDFLTIRGQRHSPVNESAHYFYQEGFWGSFSRTIVLPVDVKADAAHSEYRNGVLTIRLPKAQQTSTIPIMVIEE